MSELRKWILGRALLLAGLLLLFGSTFITTAQAQEVIPVSENSKCVVCHENLYLLHDTGNYFCICESPMTCVDCHGGDPTALTPEAAHAFRDPHPVIGDDTSRCQTCHPANSIERASLFDQKAGLSEFLVIPTYEFITVARAATIDAEPAAEEKADYWRMIPVLVLVIGSISIGIWVNKGYHPV